MPVHLRATVSTSDAKGADKALKRWVDQQCQGPFEALLCGLIFPAQGVPRVMIDLHCGCGPVAYHPLPYAKDGVVLLGRHSLGGLTVTFYDLQGARFLQAVTTLAYADRGRLGRRNAGQFAAALVEGAKAKDKAAAA